MNTPERFTYKFAWIKPNGEMGFHVIEATSFKNARHAFVDNFDKDFPDEEWPKGKITSVASPQDPENSRLIRQAE